MKPPLKPSELARKTLETLALHKLPPTPENYQQIYAELSGLDPAKHLNLTPLVQHLDNFMQYNPSCTVHGAALINALKTLDWKQYFSEVKHASGKSTPSATPATPPANQVNSGDHQETLQRFTELFSQTLENAFGHQEDLQTDLQQVVHQIRAVKNQPQAEQLMPLLEQFCHKAKLRYDNKSKVNDGLLRLLRLLVGNIGDMVENDSWLSGQIEVLQGIIANPMDKGAILDAERNLRNAIIQQNSLKNNVDHTRDQIRNLMTTFIDRMGDVANTTDDYQQKIEGYSERVSQTQQPGELGALLSEIMQDTRNVQDNVSRSRQELLDTQQQVQIAESRIKALEQQLAQVSELVQQDQLTGALNRRGLDEVFTREIDRAQRQSTPLSIALIDIDNFKQLNDTLGHQAGDHALVHLCNVMRESVRSVDSVARFGGEEFVVVMPEFTASEGKELIEKLQRDLTKKFFMENNNRVLLTFSSGVAQLQAGETPDDMMSRADKAMYHAKRTGKNRVELA